MAATDALYALKNHLEELKKAGRSGISITDESRRILREFPAHLAAARAPAPAPAATGSRIEEEGRSPRAPAPAPVSSRPESPPASSPAESGSVVSPSGDTREEQLASLRAQAASGERTRGLGTLRDPMVFAVGNPHADLMLVGEAPGSEEEAQGEPFVGPAGQLLTKILKAMGLERSDVYISNVVKFRPKIGDGERQGPRNRPPEPAEIEACLPFILSEIEIIQPKIIVALGGTAAKGLLGLEESVGRMRGQAHEIRGVPTYVTYHPSYLLRNQAMTERRKVWEDMLVVMERIGLPISDKQRAFFSK